MRFTDAIQSFLADMRSEGRLTSPASVRAYEDVLNWHAQDVGNRDPRTTNRDDVKRTLQRWVNPNTQANRRAILVSFYRWTVQEGLRPYNPAEQTRPPKKRKPTVYRLTVDECRRLMFAATSPLEQRAIHLGICAGLRRAELLGLQARHFQRPGFIWVSPDIGKGGRERYIPILADIAPLAEDLAALPDDHYVLCGSVAGIGGVKRTPIHRLIPTRPMGETTLYDLVGEVGRRAKIAAPLHPHLLRHAYADHIARLHGLQVAQALMGHADPSTTRGYTGQPTLDELAATVANTTFRGDSPPADPQKTPSYRHGDSNPGYGQPASPWHADGNPEPVEGDTP